MIRPPLIVTAHVSDHDLLFFDLLRSRFFPPDRNFLRAHVTMFHKLPPEQRLPIEEILTETAALTITAEVKVTGVRNLGTGVAFVLESDNLAKSRAHLKAAFKPWLGPQDHQPWRPHITIQNKVRWQQAEALYDMLSREFLPMTIRVGGFDLWSYMHAGAVAARRNVPVRFTALAIVPD